MAKKRKKRGGFSWQGALAGLGQGMVQNSQAQQRAALQQAQQEAVFKQQLELDRIRAAREAERNRVLDARYQTEFGYKQKQDKLGYEFEQKKFGLDEKDILADNQRLADELNWKIKQARQAEAKRQAKEAEALEFGADLTNSPVPIADTPPPGAPPANAVQPPMAGVMGGAPASQPLFPLPPNVGPAPEAPAPPIVPLPAAGGMPMGAMPAQMPAQQAEMPALPPYQAYQRRPYPKSADKPHERITWDQNEDRLEKQHNDNFDRQVNYAKTAREMMPKPDPPEKPLTSGEMKYALQLWERQNNPTGGFVVKAATEALGQLYYDYGPNPTDKAAKQKLADLKAQLEENTGAFPDPETLYKIFRGYSTGQNLAPAAGAAAPTNSVWDALQ